MIWQNLKFAVKMLRKSPLLSVTAVAALALGIGANTALFSVIDAVLLRPLSYPHPERIVEVLRSYRDGNSWATTPMKFAFWQKENQSFEAMAAHSFLPLGLNLVGRGEAQRLAGLAVTADYFRVLGVQPVLGRMYTAAEDKPGAGKYAVLSYPLWQRLFAGKATAIGGTLAISNDSYQVIGVMPRDFDTPQHADVWVPMQLVIDPTDRSNDYPVIARLKPGVTLPMAQADMRVVAERFRKAYGSNLINKGETIAVWKFRDFLVDGARQPLWILLAAVGFVLLIACANVANLLLARSTAREREMAVRVAVGASSRQIIGQLLTESMLLALAGAATGAMLAGLCLPLLLRLTPQAIPQLAGATIDWKVLLFALAAAVGTGLLFGLFPAIQSARLGIANPLRESATRTTTNAASQRVRQGLVVAEMAITLLLLIGASLLIKTLGNLQDVRPGFDSRNVLTMRMSLTPRYGSPRQLGELHKRLAARLETIPGVASVASANMLPMTAWSDLPFEIVGRPVTMENMPDERYRFISQNYFATLRIPVLEGREFTDRDTADSEPVLVINQALARQYFPRQNPIGQQILVGRIVGPLFADKVRTIVGVVGDTHDVGLERPAPPELFEPTAQIPPALLAGQVSLVPVSWMVRTTRNPMAMAEQIRREALTVAGDLPMGEAKSLSDVLSGSLARQRFVVTLLTVFAGLALLLGSVGLYGVISYSVAQRTRELGIRSALGAQRTDLLRLVVSEGMRLTALGLAVGVAAAFGLTRFLQSLLFGISPFDPLVLGAVTLLLGSVGLLACFVPAYRAARVDPLVALHQE